MQDATSCVTLRTRNTLFTAVRKIEINIPNVKCLQTANFLTRGLTGISNLTRCVTRSGSQSSFIQEIYNLFIATFHGQGKHCGDFESSSTMFDLETQVLYYRI